jgi:S1-C subfamily serine protease
MRHLIAALLLSLTLLAPAWARTKDDLAAIDPLVKIVTDASDDSHGSGVYVGGGLVITAAHVVADNVKPEVLMVDGQKTTASVVILDKPDDLAILKLRDSKLLRPAKVLCRDPEVGEEVHTEGYPLHIGSVTTFGRVATKVHPELPDWRSIVTLDITVERGMSGGPVFDTHNSLVGITAGMTTSEALEAGAFETPLMFNLAVPASSVCRVLLLALPTS